MLMKIVMINVNENVIRYFENANSYDKMTIQYYVLIHIYYRRAANTT